MGGPFLFQGIAHLLAGWLIFPFRVSSIIPLATDEARAALATLLLLAAGGHLVLRARRSAAGDGSWRARWTAGVLGIAATALVAGIAVTGAVRYGRWLVTTEEPLTRSSWPFLSEIEAWKVLDQIEAAEKTFRERSHRYGTLDELGEAGLVSERIASGSSGDYEFDAGPSVVASDERWFVTASSRRPRCRQFFKNDSGLLYQWSGEPRPFDRATCEPPEGYHHVK
ncbi:MAG: hypothetical protein ACAI25_19575 [Planctomycetota bacterium]